MEIQLDGNIFDLDPERTRAYYRKNTLCTCAGCVLFRRQIRRLEPKLAEYLDRLGADVARPDEAWWTEGDKVLEFTACYTLCGSVRKLSGYETDLRDTDPLRLVWSRSGSPWVDFPNEQTEPYFNLSVCGIRLPCDWAREEATRGGSLFRRLFRRRAAAPRPVPPIPDDATP